MNGTAAIEFDGVWKSFHHGAASLLLRSHLKRLLVEGFRREVFHALKNVTFRMDPGESVAILGVNGAGKSTLLSMVAGLVPPDRGRVQVRGRVAPLLELGSGFHPDLTGAENVRLNASLLGIGKKQLKQLYPAIVDFSEIADFIDEPLRTYSTGMVMRLAFSVAVNIDPDILLIDEVLVVGDTAFQAKCFDRILDFRARGKTILCVSHSPTMVQKLCTRAIWLDHGDLLLDGPLAEVADAYEGRIRPH